ncbi:hypothetical protein V494_00617, partial [Pseudogymnoascus sp. VKM F-4513 (FW-928)]
MYTPLHSTSSLRVGEVVQAHARFVAASLTQAAIYHMIGEGGTSQDPRPEGVKLVRARELEGTGGPGVGEERGGGGVRGVAGLEGAGDGAVVVDLEEGGGEERRGEGEEVEGDKEDFVEGAEEE